ncbi:MAG: hypothetical protein PGN13_03330 [Patulibacter minatonensis]
MSRKIRSLVAVAGATAAIAAVPAGASAAPVAGTSVTPLATGGWTVCAWFDQWKSCATVTKINGKWTVNANAAGSNVGASAGANAGLNPLAAAAQATANAGAKVVAAAASVS